MSVDFGGITEMRKRMEALVDDMPKIMEQLVIGEGVYAVGQARRICKEDGIVNNGTYRMNFHAGDKALSLGANESVNPVFCTALTSITTSTMRSIWSTASARTSSRGTGRGIPLCTSLDSRAVCMSAPIMASSMDISPCDEPSGAQSKHRMRG